MTEDVPPALHESSHSETTHRAGRLSRMIPAHPVRSGFLVALGVLLAVGLAVVLSSLSSVLVSIVLGMFLALGMDPVVRALQRRGIPRRWGITIVAVAFLVLVVAIALLVVPATIRQIAAAIENAPQTIADIESSAWFLALQTTLQVDLEAALANIVASLTSLSSFLAISGGVLRAGAGIIGAISNSVLVVVLTLYFISSLSSITSACVALVPRYRRERFSALLEEITASIGGFVAGGITLSTINATVVFVIEVLIGSPIAAVMSITAFFITLVPLIGSLIFLVIGSTTALLISPWAAVTFAISYFVYIQLEAYVVTPRVMGRSVAVPGVLVIIGAMAGAALMGLLGALVAIPITASVLIILREVALPIQDAKTVAPVE